MSQPLLFEALYWNEKKKRLSKHVYHACEKSIISINGTISQITIDALFLQYLEKVKLQIHFLSINVAH